MLGLRHTVVSNLDSVGLSQVKDDDDGDGGDNNSNTNNKMETYLQRTYRQKAQKIAQNEDDNDGFPFWDYRLVVLDL